MKKIIFAILVGLVFLGLNFSLGLANSEKVNLKGEIIAVDEVGETITIQSVDETEYTICFSPYDAFRYTIDDIGSYVHIKGVMQEDGTIFAEWVQPVVEDGENDGNGESVYCSGEKDTPHPIAIVLANRFEKEVDEIMAYFCNGFGIGQIYLALKTELVTGVDFGELLASRAEGKGWGEIWEELGYQGKPKDHPKTPPGQDKNKDKDKDKGPNNDDGSDVKEKKDKDKNKDTDNTNVKEKKPKKPKKVKDK
jgi:hypothetical protein